MKKYVIAFFCFLLFSGLSKAQLPGLIVRPAGSAGPAVLDTNINGFTSRLKSGFAGNDITNSELSYKMVAPVIPEPTGDLLRGPSGSFSDIVKTFDGSGFYLFSDGTNLLCRLRIGGIVSGSKGYSILLDTDQKFGPTGPNADPNYQAATNGNNGNPGFEFEVVFETNFRIAIYNVDGTSTPVLVTSYSLTTNSQVSVAATTDGGNPDFFYDFYVPYTAMGLSAASSIRATATTVMSPGPAIGGPKSDIYGLSGSNYMEDWTSIINQQPAFAISQVSHTGTGISAACTAPPVVNTGILSSSIQISGTWTNSTYSTKTKATIRVYNGAVLLGTVDSVNAGATWQIPVVGLTAGSLITATAHAANETVCLLSNEARVKSGCTPATQTPMPATTCAADRGFEGTRASGASIKLYQVTTTGSVLIADDATTTYRITYPSLTTWRYDDQNSQSNQTACQGGAQDIDDGTYMITAESAGSCTSSPLFVCIGNSPTVATPVMITPLVDGASIIRGTVPGGSRLSLYIDGVLEQTLIKPASDTFIFTLANKLNLNETVKIVAATTNECAGIFSTTVSCFIAAPIITADTLNRVTISRQITGASSAPTGATITIYNASTLAQIGTATVQSNGSWTMTTPTIANNTTYVAQVTSSPCGVSLQSNIVSSIAGTASTRCGTITGSISENASAVTGTLASSAANTVVTLLADGVAINSVTTSVVGWSIPVNTTIDNRIYSGAILTIEISQPNRSAVSCSATTTVTCVAPTTPVISPTTTTITSGQSVNYTITSPQSGILYSIRNNADAADAGASGFGSGASMTLTSNTFSTPGIYNLKIKATSLSGSGCTSPTSDATVTVLGALPLTLTMFNGMYDNGIVKLNWETVFEQDIEKFEIQRSTNGTDFSKISEVTATGNSTLRNNYFFNDADGNSNVLYYRLRIIDKSSSVPKYSKVIVIRTDKGIVLNQVSPNPFMNEINMSFNASGKMPIVITLTDMGGRMFRKVDYTSKKGMNNILLDGLGSLSAGTYLIEIVAEGDRISRELLIKR